MHRRGLDLVSLGSAWDITTEAIAGIAAAFRLAKPSNWMAEAPIETAAVAVAEPSIIQVEFRRKPVEAVTIETRRK